SSVRSGMRGMTSAHTPITGGQTASTSQNQKIFEATVLGQSKPDQPLGRDTMLGYDPTGRGVRGLSRPTIRAGRPQLCRRVSQATRLERIGAHQELYAWPADLDHEPLRG